MVRRASVVVANGAGNGTIVFPTAITAVNDYTNASITAPSSVAANWTTNGYVIVSGDVNAGADYIQARWLKVNN
jgi:hypothetical protein